MENKNNNQKIVAAIIVAAFLIAAAILLKGKTANNPTPAPTNIGSNPTITLAPVSSQDRILGNPNAKVVVVEYSDFQCPFCGRFFKDAEAQIRNTYVKNGQVEFIFRDYAFLGPESVKAAQAARCAGDQGKFWDFHDYLFNHQNGENQGNFVDANLKSFAKDLGLDTTTFNQCLDSGKYASAVTDSTTSGTNAGVSGTPKSFILKDGKIVDTIDGAEPFTMVQPKIDAALK